MKIITISIFTILVILFILFLFSANIPEFFYQRLILANNPTILFPCSAFQEKFFLENIISDNVDYKIQALEKYLLENDGDIYIDAVGNRCPNKYQFVISFGSETQRNAIEKILEDQTINGTPVFLLNQ